MLLNLSTASVEIKYANKSSCCFMMSHQYSVGAIVVIYSATHPGTSNLSNTSGRSGYFFVRIVHLDGACNSGGDRSIFTYLIQTNAV